MFYRRLNEQSSIYISRSRCTIRRMGKEFYDNFSESKEIFNRANEALGFDIAKLCFEGPDEKLSVTKITQPAILTVCMAIFEVIKRHKNIEPVAMGGLSLGEYVALTAADAMDFETAD